MTSLNSKMLELISIYEENGFVFAEIDTYPCFKKTIVGLFGAVNITIRVGSNYNCSAHFEIKINNEISYYDYFVFNEEEAKKPAAIQSIVESVIQLIKLFNTRGFYIPANKSYTCGIEFINEKECISFFISPDYFIFSNPWKKLEIKIKRFHNENCETIFDEVLQKLMREEKNE
jgi:hypothetical protein